MTFPQHKACGRLETNPCLCLSDSNAWALKWTFFFFFLSELYYTYNKIHSFKVYNLVVFSTIYSQRCATITAILIPEHFITPKLSDEQKLG